MLDREQVQKVAHLARLDLTPDEETQFTAQLGGILEYFEQLSELDTSQVQPTTRAIDVSNVTRADKMEVYGNRDAILNGAPEPEETAQGEFFKVPQIMGGTD